MAKRTDAAADPPAPGNPWTDYAAAYSRIHDLTARLAAAQRPAVVSRLTAQLHGARKRAAAAQAAIQATAAGEGAQDE